ncbi:MAG: hypothetical protein GEU76_11410 [Alphaproteobacteria bacterium]|nr:hypothetical protein [Alphaproteobacteria bacterium]
MRARSRRSLPGRIGVRLAPVLLALAVALPAGLVPARAAEDQSPAAKEEREYQWYQERRERREERQQQRIQNDAERARDKALRQDREQDWQQRRRSLDVPRPLGNDAAKELLNPPR